MCVVFFYKNFRVFDASDPGAPSLPSVAQPLHLPRALRLLAQVGFSNGHDDSDLMWECGSFGWFEVPSLRKANLHSKTTGRDYWKDVAELHISLGLGLRHGSTVAIAPLTRWYSKHVTFCMFDLGMPKNTNSAVFVEPFFSASFPMKCMCGSYVKYVLKSKRISTSRVFLCQF